ncbi:hypothetical protein LY78DRAFT_592469, partial [Colletotrichum sublineola]
SRIRGKSANKVAKSLGISCYMVKDILAYAKKQGFNPSAPTFSILPKYYNNTP